LSGVLSGDLMNVNLSTNGYAASFANVGPGTNIAVTVNGLTLAGSAGANYTIAPVALSANISGSLFMPTVTTMVSSTNNPVYGTAVSFTAIVSPSPTNGETVAFMVGGNTLGTGVLSGGVASYTTSSTQLAVAGSPYTVTAVYGGDGYYQSSASGGLSQAVTTATVMVASGLTANDKTYDGTTTATINSNGISLNGVIAADAANVSLSTNGCTAVFTNQNTGNGIAVTVGGLTLTGSAAGNYTLAQPILSANIMPATVTITNVMAMNKMYNGDSTAILSGGVVSGAVNGDNVTFTAGVGIFASQFVGIWTVTASGYVLNTSDVSTNYTLLAQPVVPNASITPAMVMIVSGLIANNKVYDGTPTATINSNSVSLSGVIVGDVANVNLSTNGYMASFASAGANSNLLVMVAGLALTGSAASNYVLTQPSLTASIAPAALTVTADNQSRTFGLPNPALTASYNGFVNGEGTNVLITLASVTTTADVNSPVGEYPIMVSGATAVNYVFNYAPGTLTVVTPPVLAGVNAGVNGYQLTFPTLVGQMYQVEFKTNLTDTVWTPLGDPIPGSGSFVSVTNLFDESQAFFWLQISQP
jgi:trimeric autotransporter adhesin